MIDDARARASLGKEGQETPCTQSRAHARTVEHRSLVSHRVSVAPAVCALRLLVPCVKPCNLYLLKTVTARISFFKCSSTAETAGGWEGAWGWVSGRAPHGAWSLSKLHECITLTHRVLHEQGQKVSRHSSHHRAPLLPLLLPACPPTHRFSYRVGSYRPGFLSKNSIKEYLVPLVMRLTA